MDISLRSLVHSIQLVDVVDVLLVAALFFVAISAVRQSRPGSAARRIAVLGLLFAAMYVVVDAFDLRLMERLLGVLFVAFLIAVVVVFQTDIRRLLDRMATWRFPRRGTTTAPSSPAQLLAEAAWHLAETRTGALIAIRGDESWDSHVQGGVELNGTISRPLLDSIFHPESPGHDGAVLVEGDRLTCFAVHLPLATRLPDRSWGTRHAAGLGLVEECDALTVVVSEERGTVSVGEKGMLQPVSSAAELSERLDRFWRAHYAAPPSVRERWRSRRTLESAAMALGLAGLTWFLFSYSTETVSRTYDVPIELRNLPSGWVLESDTVPTVQATLSGSEVAFERLEPDRLTISLDLPRPDTGANALRITRKSLRLPSGVRLDNVHPREVTVVAWPQDSPGGGPGPGSGR